jgi:hypothetical protein
MHFAVYDDAYPVETKPTSNKVSTGSIIAIVIGIVGGVICICIIIVRYVRVSPYPESPAYITITDHAGRVILPTN